MMLPRYRVCALALVVCSIAAPLRAQVNAGWKASANGGNRYTAQENASKGTFTGVGGNQQPPAAPAPGAKPGPPGDITPVEGGLVPVTSGITRARVTKGAGTLPQDKGQVWREYDIRPYTLRVTTTARPEQAIVDWILRETGYEAWHSEPLGILSANGRTLRVYHTPQMQEQVSEIVDRFVNTQAETQSFGLRVMTIGSPSWRAKAQRVLRPVSVQSQGVQAWLLSKEDAALMTAEIAKRTDFR